LDDPASAFGMQCRFKFKSLRHCCSSAGTTEERAGVCQRWHRAKTAVVKLC